MRHFVDTWRRDVRQGARLLRQRPGFTLIAALTLALGVGATTAVFSLVYALLLRPLPFTRPEELVRTTAPALEHAEDGPIRPDLTALRDRRDVFTDGGAFMTGPLPVSGVAEPMMARGAQVSASLFRVLGVAPARGRLFADHEEREGENRVAIVSDRFWKRAMTGIADPLGRTLIADGKAVTIIGVMAPGFDYPERTDVWVPWGVGQDTMVQTAYFIWAIGRLRPGVDFATATRMMQIPEGQGSRQLARVDELMREPVRRPVLLLLGAVAALLLLACTNLSSLLLTRALGQQRDMAVRSALGCSRGRLVRQVLTEHLVLAAPAGALGLLLAWWTMTALVAWRPPALLEQPTPTLDVPVLAFALIATLAATLLAGIGPALHASRAGVGALIGSSPRLASGAMSRHVREGLIAVQIAASLALLVAASLLVISLVRLQQVDLGFRKDHVLMADLTMPKSAYEAPPLRAALVQQLIERLAAQPQVRGVGAVSYAPFAQRPFAVMGVFVEGSRDPETAPMRAVTPAYLPALGIRILRGRGFRPTDGESARVAVLSQSLAKKLFGDADPLGRQIRYASNSGELMTVIGVADDLHDMTPRQTTNFAPLYVPYGQYTPSLVTVALWSDAADIEPLVATLRRELQALDPHLPLDRVITMTRATEEAMATERFAAMALTLFGVLAVVLAATGVYGTVAYATGRRTQEFGLRVALGATPGSLARLVLRDQVRPLLIGAVLGLAGAFALTRLLAHLLYGLTPHDPAVFTGATLLLIAIVTAAAFLPARRASGVDPMQALRVD